MRKHTKMSLFPTIFCSIFPGVPVEKFPGERGARKIFSPGIPGVGIPGDHPYFSVWNTGEPNNTDGSEECVEISNYIGYSNWNE